MARNRKTSFDAAALAHSSTKDDDDHVLGLAISGSRSHDGSSDVTKTSGASSGHLGATLTGTSAMDHLDALGDDAASLPIKDGENTQKTGGAGPLGGTDDEHSGGSGATLASSNQRILLEALMGVTGSSATSSKQRDRLESWGGMSDLSIAGVGDTGSLGKGGSHAAAALAASALHHTGIIGDVTAAAAAIDFPASNLASISSGAASLASSTSGADHHAKVPTKISLTSDRKYSGASLSDTSAQTHTADGKEISPDIQAFVAAAMATVGDQLKELAGTVESVASSTADSVVSDKARLETESRAESVSESATLATAEVQSATEDVGRPRSLSTSSAAKPISVDYDAVAAAVNAAEAATCAIDLTAIADMAPPPVSTGKPKKKNHRSLPLNKRGDMSSCSTPRARASGPLHLPPVPQTTMSAQDMEAIRARARAAAGYVPPEEGGPISAKRSGGTARAPLKKRAKRLSPEPDRVQSHVAGSAGKVPYGNVASSKYVTPGKRANPVYPGDVTSTPGFVPDTPFSANTPASAVSRGQATQKWDDMFDCLLKFVEERREKELKGKSDKEKETWEWDGNVPTTYKVRTRHSFSCILHCPFKC